MKTVNVINVLLMIFSVNLLAGCSWVKLTPEGEKVRVLSVTEVSSCKKLGKTTVSLKSTIAGFERNEEKVKTELETLARNRAIDLGGDTVVPVSKISKGQQTFGIYRCVQP